MKLVIWDESPPDGYLPVDDNCIPGEADELLIGDVGKAANTAQVAELVRLVRPGGAVRAGGLDIHDLAGRLLGNLVDVVVFGSLVRGRTNFLNATQVADLLRSAGVDVDRVFLINSVGWAVGRRR